MIKLKQIVNGYSAVCALCALRLKAGKAMELARFAKKLSFYFDSYINEEKKLVCEYCNTDEKGEPVLNKGAVTFKSKSEKEEYIKEREELLNTDIEDIEPICIDNSDIKTAEAMLTARDIILMEGLIDIKEQEAQ